KPPTTTLGGAAGGTPSELGQGAAVPPDNAALIEILVTILKDCICIALNPPCVPCNDTGVLLACLKVQGCDVVEICNLSRHFALTPAALRYWLSFGEIEALLRQFCCLEKQTETTTLMPGLPQVAEPAMRLRGLFYGLAAMQPARSDQAVSFMRIASAFGDLAGVPSDTTTAQIPPEVLKQAVTDEVNATFGDKLATVQTTSDEVVALQGQVKTVTDQLATLHQISPDELKT